MDRLDHALALAKQGLLILPIQPGRKIPYGGESWSQIMTTDEAVIRGWFADPNRGDMNYAVCPGRSAVVLDPDVDKVKGKNGWAALKLLEADHFEEEITGETLTVRSPRGGRHLYLRTPYSVSNAHGEFSHDIDVRGFGGYVLGPGSHTLDLPAENTAEGTYTIECDKPPMRAPQWIMDMLATSLGRHQDAQQEPFGGWDTPSRVQKVIDKIRAQTCWPTEGAHGDDHVYAFIALIKDEGVSQDKGIDLLNTALYEDGTSWNENCAPPWTVEELQTKFENVYTYGRNQPGEKGGTLEAAGDYIAQAAQAGLAGQTAELAEARKEVLGKLDTISFSLKGLLERKVHREYVAQDFLLAHGVTACLAKRGTGKTVAMVDLASRIACDMDWHDIRVKKDWAVVYVCGEDDVGAQDNFAGWCKMHSITEAPDDRFLFMAGTMNLMSGEDVATWAEHVRSKLPGKRVITFLDTWQRATSQAGQNDDKDMQNAMANAEAFAKAMNGPCVIAFHPPKNNPDTLMGSSILENTTVGIWTIKMDERQNFYRILRVARLKGKGEGNELKLHYKEIGIGRQDDFGKEATGLVATKLGGSEGKGVDFSGNELNNSRSIYATIIADLWMDYADEDDKKNHKASDWSSTDTAERIQKLLNGDGNDAKKWKRLLLENHDKSWELNSFRKTLGPMFSDGVAQRTHNDHFVSFRNHSSNANGVKKFGLDEKAKADFIAARSRSPSEDDDMGF